MSRQDEMMFQVMNSYFEKAFGLVDRAITAQVDLTKALASEGGCSETFIELRSMEMKESREALRDFGTGLKEVALAAERAHERTLAHGLELRKLELAHQLELKKLELSAPPKSEKELDVELLQAKTGAINNAPWNLREEVTAAVFGVEPKKPAEQNDEFDAQFGRKRA